MIDFHTHILPNIDDGAQSIDETFKLINEAKSSGFDAIISTSHYMEGYYEKTKLERLEWINALNITLKKTNLELVVYLGNEIYISNNIISLLENKKACSINDTSYVLFELPFNTKPLDLNEIVYEMLKYKFVPIVAHPERYSFVQKDPNVVTDLIRKGVLVQSNYGSIVGQYGEKAKLIFKKLLENNMIHFLGTDVHKPNTIYPQIPKILKKLEKIVEKDKIEKISTTNARHVLDNQKIEIDEPQEIKLSFKEKLILQTK